MKTLQNICEGIFDENPKDVEDVSWQEFVRNIQDGTAPRNLIQFMPVQYNKAMKYGKAVEASKDQYLVYRCEVTRSGASNMHVGIWCPKEVTVNWQWKPFKTHWVGAMGVTCIAQIKPNSPRWELYTNDPANAFKKKRGYDMALFPVSNEVGEQIVQALLRHQSGKIVH